MYLGIDVDGAQTDGASLDENYAPLSGRQKHLGEITVPQNPAEAREAAGRLVERGAEAFAVIRPQPQRQVSRMA